MKFKTIEPNPNFEEVNDVDPREVHDNQTQLVLIDVRRPDEYTGELGHIPGAHLLTLDKLPNHIETLPKDKPIVFICRSGARSANATSMAIECGYTEVYNMKGGMILWNQHGFDVEY